MSTIYDAGALIALERGDEQMGSWFLHDLHLETPLKTHGGVVAQVWRGGAGRQARLAVALRSVEIVPLDGELGRRAGILLARCNLSDVVDAALVAMAENGDEIITSDPRDFKTLVAASQRRVNIIDV